MIDKGFFSLFSRSFFSSKTNKWQLTFPIYTVIFPPSLATNPTHPTHDPLTSLQIPRRSKSPTQICKTTRAGDQSTVTVTVAIANAKRHCNTTTTRSPLTPSETDNAAATRPPAPPLRRRSTKDIATPNSSPRPSYSSSAPSSDSYSSARRFPSAFHTPRPQSESTETLPKTSSLPGSASASASARTLCRKMTRSFSVSFQSELFFYQTCRANETPPPCFANKYLQERRRKTGDGDGDGDGRRPASTRSVKKLSMLSRSLGFSMESKQQRSQDNHQIGGAQAPSLIIFAAQVRRAKKREKESRIEEAHLLRLLHNRHLQLRFVNPRAKAAVIGLGISTEKTLYSASVAMTEMRNSIATKWIKLLLLRQNLKLTSILKGQMACLEECFLIERKNPGCLYGCIEALRASTIRLPVVSGAGADAQDVKVAVGSADYEMETLGSSICSLLLKTERMDSLLSKLTKVAFQELALLDEVRYNLPIFSVLHEELCSLRSQKLQLRRKRAMLSNF